MPINFKTREEYNTWMRGYRRRNIEKFRNYQREYNRLWRKKNKIFHASKWASKVSKRAKEMVKYYLKAGKLKKENCKFCGSKNAVAHHEDYNKPLDVLWVCRICHREIHYANIRTGKKSAEVRAKKILGK